MFDELLHIDRQILLAINGAHAPWADVLFWQVSQPATWLPLYVLLLWLLWYNLRTYPMAVRWRMYALMVLSFALAVGGADLLCAQVIKPLVARPRPTHDAGIGALVHVVNGYRGGAYGFCSNHAANTMATALLTVWMYNRQNKQHALTWALMGWVLINCYSRMYLGVHYPLDIFAGLLVGSVMAYGAWWGVRRCLAWLEEHVRPAGAAATADAGIAQE